MEISVHTTDKLRLEVSGMGIALRNKPVSEMSMSELAYNDCYIKDRQAMYRDYDTDMSARDLIRAIYEARYKDMPTEFWEDDESFDEIMLNNLQYGGDTFEGIMAILYQQIWSKAEMREVLLKISEIYDITAFI